MNSIIFDVGESTLKAEIARAIAPLFDATVVAHDMFHLYRVASVAAQIGKKERANEAVVVAASMLHDYHRYLEKCQGRHVAPEEAEPAILALLKTIESIPNTLHRPICDAINFTEYYKCAGDDLDSLKPTIEAKVVRDADMLDALGAVGIARAFMFGGFLAEPMWVPSDAVDGERKAFMHGKTSSVVHHFYEKLLHLQHEMLTERGRELAEKRTQYMEAFLAQLMEDIA